MPTGPLRVSNIDVSIEDADAFKNAFSTALNRLSAEEARHLYLFPRNRGALAISLDGEYLPFIGITAGLNYHSNRLYLEGKLRFFEQLAGIVESLQQPLPGGRVFLSDYSAMKGTEDVAWVTLCTYEWPVSGPHTMAKNIFEAKFPTV